MRSAAVGGCAAHVQGIRQGAGTFNARLPLSSSVAVRRPWTRVH